MLSRRNEAHGVETKPGGLNSPKTLHMECDDPRMRFAVSEYVRWEDIDAAGIINYQAYLRFFGLAEVELFRSCGLSYKTLFGELDLWLPRVHVECDFLLPVTLDELLVVEAFFGKIGTSSIHLNFEVTRKERPGEVVATGKYILVAVRQGEFKPVPVPDAVREKLRPYLETE
jgi:acyl-CoA thioester hydrolase